MFFDNKLFISANCENLIKELETHHFKEWWKKDGEVDKTMDDALDALRYWLFSYKPPKYIWKKEKNFINKYWVQYNSKWIYQSLYNNPY